MTSIPASRTAASDRRPATSRAVVALVTVLAEVVVGMAGLLASPASAAPLFRVQNGVGVIHVTGSQRVRFHEPILAGQGRIRAPGYDRIVVGSCVAPETEGAGARGLSDLGGVIEETGSNNAGGRIFTSTGGIAQKDFAGIVNSGLMRDEPVSILTGAHGLQNGSLVPDSSLLADDTRAFGSLPGVQIYDINSMSTAEVQAVLYGPGTIIGAFSDSGACLARYGG
jgi:hypothetical protein